MPFPHNVSGIYNQHEKLSLFLVLQYIIMKPSTGRKSFVCYCVTFLKWGGIQRKGDIIYNGIDNWAYFIKAGLLCGKNKKGYNLVN